MRRYETVFVVNPQADIAAIDGQVAAVTNLIKTNGGEILVENRMGTRRLAYPLAGLLQGNFTSVIFDGETSILPRLERLYKLEEPYIRHLTIRYEGQIPVDGEEAASIPDDKRSDSRRGDRGDRGGRPDRSDRPAPARVAPKAGAPKAEAPKAEAPKAEAPKAEAPKAEAPKAEAPKADAPKAEAPKADAPKAEAPKADAPAAPEKPAEEAAKPAATETEKPEKPQADQSDPADEEL